MLMFTLTNHHFLVKEKVRTTMKQVLLANSLGPSERLIKQRQEPDQLSAAAQQQ